MTETKYCGLSGHWWRQHDENVSKPPTQGSVLTHSSIHGGVKLIDMPLWASVFVFQWHDAAFSSAPSRNTALNLHNHSRPASFTKAGERYSSTECFKLGLMLLDEQCIM